MFFLLFSFSLFLFANSILSKADIFLILCSSKSFSTFSLKSFLSFIFSSFSNSNPILFPVKPPKIAPGIKPEIVPNGPAAIQYYFQNTHRSYFHLTIPVIVPFFLFLHFYCFVPVQFPFIFAEVFVQVPLTFVPFICPLNCPPTEEVPKVAVNTPVFVTVPFN